MQMNRSINAIFEIKECTQFDALALETFRFQANHCEVYKTYLDLLGIHSSKVNNVSKIPFLPVELFKTHTVYCGVEPAQQIFTSSATTGMTPAKHHIAKISIYEESFTRSFRLFIGAPEHYSILALLPSYSERSDSSLIYMVNQLMLQSGDSDNRYFLYNHEDLFHHLISLRNRKKTTLLFGVTFALLDFLNHYTIDFPDLEIIETGGMKGRGKEFTRKVLHQIISQGFGTNHIYSEYGMAELLSQAYAKEGVLFMPPPWMAVFVRDMHDPFRFLANGQLGVINIIDLANRYSCSFIETQDMGIIHSNNCFEVTGRIPFSELRGCNLLLE